MKSLQSYLSESTNDRGWLDEKTCKQILSDYLELKAKQNKIKVSKKRLKELVDAIYGNYYQNEDSPEDFTMEREFRDYVDKTIINAAECTEDWAGIEGLYDEICEITGKSNN